MPVWKQEHPHLNGIHSQVLQNVQVRVDLAFKAFFRRVKKGATPGFPRFKGKGRYASITYPQSGFKVTGGNLVCSKIGALKLRLHRPIEDEVKTVTLRRTATGAWYACFSVEYEPQPLPPSDAVVGIDGGLEQFATLSTGEGIANPRFFRKGEKRLAKIQRKLSKLDTDTTQYRNQKHVVAHVHNRIASQRKDFAHKLSRTLVNTYGVIAIEDLHIRNMLRNGHLAKSIADAAWNQRAQFLLYKAEDAGRKVVQVDPRHTSQLCSQCGSIVKKPLSERMHVCPHCHLSLNRDHNAAINILRVGLHSLGANP